MNTKIFGGLLMVAVLAITSTAKADAVVNHQRRAHHKFEHRLHKDVRSGELTREEAKHFNMEAKHIQAERRMAIAHGTFTPAEKMHIHNERKMLVHNLRRDERRNENKVRG